MYCSGRDITERKAAERESLEREELLQSIFRQASDGIALIETETLRFVQFNDALSDRFGYSGQEFSTLSGS